MKRKKSFIQNPAAIFAAGFFIGLFIRFLPFFIAAMLVFLAAGGIYKLQIR